MTNIFNGRTVMSLLAVAIVFATIFFSNYLAGKIAGSEKQRIEQWALAISETADPNLPQTKLNTSVFTENNKDIPIIFVNEKDSIIDTYNLDTARLSDKNYLDEKLKELKKYSSPIVWTNPLNPEQKDKIYYGPSFLLQQIKYFPILQLLVVSLFIVATLFAINARNKSTQNQVWAGMAKETAHQLGTPITSLKGWIALLQDMDATGEIAEEMSKDVDRLQLVSDRFGKIGSPPQLEETDIYQHVANMVEYTRRRAPQKVKFSMEPVPAGEVTALISPPLFDWVIENLLKNSLDAMDGRGEIKVSITEQATETLIDVKDSGKGIPRTDWQTVFKPGYTTKKRGWGLGLSLSKRIIEQYHKGSLFIKNSEPDRGTTFRIVLRK